MKYLLILLLAFLTGNYSFGAPPHSTPYTLHSSLFSLHSSLFTDPEGLPVYSIVREMHEPAWYREQAEIWKAILDKQPSNGDAWLYFYRAVRNLKILGQNTTAYNQASIAQEAAKAIPNTYQSNLLNYLEGSKLLVDNQLLLKAAEQAPNRWEWMPEALVWHEVYYDEKQLEDVSKRWLSTNEISPGILNWNYNAIKGLPENALLITFGDNDTQPLWLLQYGRGIRKDVAVMNVFLAKFGDYRGRILQRLGMADPAKGKDLDNASETLQTIIQTCGKPVYLMIGAPEEITAPLEDYLYVTGLTYRYSKKPYENLPELRRNFEHHWLKDQLRYDFTPDISSSVLKLINANYLPSLITLYSQYMENGEPEMARDVADLCLEIAQQVGKRDDVVNYLNVPLEIKGTPMVSINIRKMENGFKKVNEHLYAGETEVTFAQYDLFLQDLLQRRQFDLLNACRIQPHEWKNYLPEQFRNTPDDKLFLYGKVDGPNFPVHSISYEAAQLYVEWLTTLYNSSSDKRKTFGKVKFKLPSKAEWEEAALGGKKGDRYPWGTGFVRNKQGCWLANYDINEPTLKKDNPALPANDSDGSLVAAPADTYFPNNIGLYNTSGNVAEMISEKGIAKGGSWYHAPYLGAIDAQVTYEKPEPFVGFRVFMEVIE